MGNHVFLDVNYMAYKQKKTNRRTFLKAAGATGLGAFWAPQQGKCNSDIINTAEHNCETRHPNVKLTSDKSDANSQLSQWAQELKPVLAVPQDLQLIEAWLPKASQALRQIFHLSDDVDTNPQITSHRITQFDSLVVHHIGIKPADRQGWNAVILEPEKGDHKRPAWLCLHGCLAGGMSSVIGLIVNQAGGKESLELCEGDYALKLAKRGFITMSFDFAGFASRGGNVDVSKPPMPTDEMCFSAIMLDKSYLGWCVADCVVALSVLKDWPSVYADKVGVVGFSMGSTIASMLAVVDRRVKAAAVSGHFPSWRERVSKGLPPGGIGCVPGLLCKLDVCDILAAVAPVPFFISQEVRGDIKNARSLLAGVERAYRAMNAEKNLMLYFDDTSHHRFIGEPLYRWSKQLWPV